MVLPTVLNARVLTAAHGAPDAAILRSARYADPDRLRLAAVYLHRHGDPRIDRLWHQARRWGCPLHAIGQSGLADLTAFRSLVQLCRHQHVAVWHAHDVRTVLLGMLLRRFRPMRLVATVHDSPAADRCCRLSRHLADLVLPRYDHVIAVSPPVVHHCRMQSVPERRLTMLAPAVDTREFRRSRSTHEAKRLLEVPDGHAVIGVVGPLVHEHRIDRAMRAFAQLRRVRRHTMMHVVGDGPERQALGELARKLKLEDAVRFWGWQSGTQLYYEAMDAVIVPGGIGTEASSVLEAMAMETPVATVSTNGAAAALGDGACGLILGDDDATWADRLAELLDQPMQRHAFALSARKRAEAEYRFDRRAEELHHLYHRLLSLHRSEPPAAEARQAA